MSALDRVRCRYPLPDPEAQDLEYQTKSMPMPYADNYLVTPEGRLLCEDYDMREEENADAPLGFFLQRENPRWVPADFRGELEIHTSVHQSDGSSKWYSYLLWIRDNRVADVQRGSECGRILAPIKPLKGSP